MDDKHVSKETQAAQGRWQTERSDQLFERAAAVIPGGVNSPVRAFRSVGRHPVFITAGKGAIITDVDGNDYIDFVGSWGPLLLGHAHPDVVEAVSRAATKGLSFGAATEGEVELAELVTSTVPGVESLRLVNSGTEAVMSAIRLARGYTGRKRIVKFNGCYHGHSDGLLVSAGSGLMTAGVPDSAGVPAEFTQLTIPCAYNDVKGLEKVFSECGDEIAAVIVEPVAANMGVCPPQPSFLEKIRQITASHGALLIFDEVITGFRLAFGGAQEYFGVTADLVTYGKIIGGGMPMGAYGGRKEIMDMVAPTGRVYQAGTLSGNPLAVAAGRAMLNAILDDKNLYERLEKKAAYLAVGLERSAREAGICPVFNRVGSLMSVFFTNGPVVDHKTAQSSDTKAYARYFNSLLSEGIYVAPSQFEAMFVSRAHSYEQLDRMIEKAVPAFRAAAVPTVRAGSKAGSSAEQGGGQAR